MARIVVCMPYFDRQFQLDKTLATIAKSRHTDFSVVIVDDNSPRDIVRPYLPFKVDIIKLREKSWTNCAPVWNIGFAKALSYNPDIIVLQSPECYHVGDLISNAEKIVTDRNYLAFGCFRLNEKTTFSKHDIFKLAASHNYGVGSEWDEDDNAWWNHPIYNEVPQYWGTAISARNLVNLNGIDERFAHGYAYEDGYFVHQVKNLGLRIDITAYPFVVHQWHERGLPAELEGKPNPNVLLYEELMKDDNYRAQHHITPDLVWSGN
jgi:glycosyltransferase involved in cell wall biosynthesis